MPESESVFELATDGPCLIVVGVDGTEASLRAFAYAIGVARRHGAEMIAVTVESEVPAASAGAAAAAAAGVPMWVTPDGEGRHDHEHWLLDRLVADATTWSARFELLVCRGDPAAELARVAQESRADMVVVGASAHLAHRLVGSLPQRLSHRRRWVLTVVP